ncbi:ImmA/IrrE family metallo-endopeptidase [Beijerinckia indica]|uniref:IrrE N-terminal-like domain-containing protein n=1 Tax=Beijerinckia indica subsp. indica (strain ATCC 9039 / DSM 1715 / NCIMB 8712) TaxID=395963 RepID=B2IB92_BEII9|nr:ImmA/IrrE family metallo-endopeptidase [Beijerinckia indica]ACB95176.1 conserved hypothetical protein [Beijerinckia indica subsp. indica ATCC 9039]
MTDGLEFTPDWFSKPGDSLHAQMVRRGLSAQQVAQNLDGGIATLRGLLDGSKAIDAEHARVLSASLGGTVSFWLKRQSNYQDALERALERASADVDESEAWLQLQVPGPRPKGRLSGQRRRDELRRRLTFFNVGTMNAWNARYGRICSETLFRTSSAFESKDTAVLMWLRMGELATDLVTTRPWNVGNLRDRLDAIKALSKVKRPELFLPKLKALCAEAGVAVVAKKAPEGCCASGASRMVGPDKAMILMSFRGLADDKFWFTLLHEIGHLLLHEAKTFVDNDMEGIDQSEREANAFAAQCIVPFDRYEEFENLGDNRNSVIRFSVRSGVAPGLIVGQMQHHKMIRPNALNDLKKFWKWSDLSPVLD